MLTLHLGLFGKVMEESSEESEEGENLLELTSLSGVEKKLELRFGDLETGDLGVGLMGGVVGRFLTKEELFLGVEMT